MEDAMTRKRILVAALGVTLAMPAPVLAQVRQPIRTQDRMQDHIARMDAQIQRMDQLRSRIQKLDHDILKQMDRIRDQDRLREHQRLRDLCDGSQKMVQEMERNMKQLRQMAGDPVFARDQEMQQEMERLRQHWDDAATQIENGLQILERLRQRLGETS
jgi:hypothetical protein